MAIKFLNNSSVTGQLTVTNGIEMTSGNFNAGDNERIRLGNSADLQIYHDGSDSYISDQGTGSLKILATDFDLANSAANASMIRAIDGAQVELYYGGAKKFETTSTGVSVTGNGYFSGDVSISGGDLNVGSGSTVNSVINMLGTNDSFIEKDTGNHLYFANNVSDKNIAFRIKDSGTNIVALTIKGSDGGNVGIGTTIPQSKLHIESGSGGTYNPNVNHDDLTIEGSGNIGLQLFSPANSYQYIAFGDPDSVNAGYLRYYHGANEMVFRTNGGDRMVIDDNGNVGIGTTSPSQKLHVAGNMRLTGAFRDGVNSQGSANYVLTSTGSNSTRWVDASTVIGGPYLPLAGGTMTGDTKRGDNIYSYWGNSDDLAIYHLNGASSIYDRGAGNLNIFTNGGSIGLRKDSGENMLIANIDGSVDLYYDNSKKFETTSTGVTVTGNVKLNSGALIISGTPASQGAQTRYISGAATTNDLWFNVPTNGRYRFAVADSQLVEITSAGNVGIGTTSPTSKLTISSGVGGDGSWNDSGILIENTSTTTGEPTLAFRNAGTAGTGSSYWFTGLNQSNLYKIAFGTSFTDGNTKLELSTTGGLRLNSYTQGFLQTDANGNVSTSGGGVLPGGPYLPLTAGSGSPLTGDLYITKNSPLLTITDTLASDLKLEIKQSGSTANFMSRGGTSSKGQFNFRITDGSTITSALFINQQANVGIGTTSPSQKLHVIGNAKVSGVLYSSILSNDNGVSQKFRSSTASDLMTILEGGNVGIGTTSPSNKLEVIGRTKITQSGDALRINSSDANGPYVTWQNNGSNIGYIGAGYHLWSSPNNIATSLGIRAQTRLDLGIQANVYMTILNSGNVGIGTTSPSQKLHVVGTSNFQGAIQVSGGTFVDSTRRNIYLDSFAGGGANGIFFRDGFTYNASITAEDHNGGSADGICISGYDGVSFSTGANTRNERMRIALNGNVGIGTTSPGAKLHVVGSGSSGQFALSLQNSSNGDGIKITTENQTANNGFLWNQGSSNLVNMYSSSTTNAAKMIMLAGGVDKIFFNTEGSSYFNGGNVGIGTTAPSQKLHVAGNMRLQNQLYDSTNSIGSNGQVLTKTSAGTIWADNRGLTPTTPGGIVATIVGETIEIAFNQSTTSNIDYYQVWSSDDGGDYGIIGQIAPTDFSSTMTVVDTTFVTGGTMSYRVYAVKSGVYSPAGTVSKAYTVSALSVTNMTVVNLNTAYYIQYEKPLSRFIDHVEIYMDSQTTSAALNRSNASIVYSGQNSSYMRSVGTSNNFHQFWVEIVTS